MIEGLQTTVYPLLERLARFFVWGRRRLQAQIQEALAALAEEYASLKRRHGDLQQEAAQLEQRQGDLEAAVTQLRLANQLSADAMQALEAQHAALSERSQLVARLLAAEPGHNPGLLRFSTVLKDDYLPFANEESSLAEEAQAFLLLQQVQEELQLLASFSGAYGKTIVAIGGGFSAGKSEFISSFFGHTPVSLAIGIKPVTALPAYVVASDSSYIRGHAPNGGAVALAPAFYQTISHDFIKLLGFDLKKIMPFVSIGVPLDRQLFDHLCLIDTPGYNPATDGGYSAQDRAVAQRFVGRAHVLLWVLSLDVNGTLSESDLQFIRDADLKGRSLYVVLNKADLRTASDIEEIMDEVEELLEDEGIVTQGLSAYSSVRKREYAYRRQPLADFLQSCNQGVEVRQQILAQVDRVFAMYQAAITADIERTAQVHGAFKSMQLDVLQYGTDQLSDALTERFRSVRQSFETGALTAQLERAEEIRLSMRAAVEQALAHVDAERQAGTA